MFIMVQTRLDPSKEIYTETPQEGNTGGNIRVEDHYLKVL